MYVTYTMISVKFCLEGVSNWVTNFENQGLNNLCEEVVTDL